MDGMMVRAHFIAVTNPFQTQTIIQSNVTQFFMEYVRCVCSSFSIFVLLQ